MLNSITIQQPVKVKLPGYTWVEPGFSCIAIDWIGGISYESGERVVQHLYRLCYQVKGVRSAVILGQIEFIADQGWLIRSVGRHALPAGESLVYSTWESARDYLWEQHQSATRKAIAKDADF